MRYQYDIPSSAAHVHLPQASPFDGGHGYSHRNKLGLFLVWIFTGLFGGHRFYLGDLRGGAIQLLLNIFTLGLASIISFFDGLALLFTRNEDEDGKAILGWNPAPSATLEKKHQSKYYRDFLAGKTPVELEKAMDKEALLVLFGATICSPFGGAFLAPLGWYLMANQSVVRAEVGLASSVLVTIVKCACIVSSVFATLLLALCILFAVDLGARMFIVVFAILGII
ncbi:MAG: TM2 domain-containing protein [Deltaproteobacteria bacterium]|nr:TM2 domain-containing protein [Deltaproteobacteria bacterium]